MNCFQAEIAAGHAIMDMPAVETNSNHINSNTLILFAHGAGAAMNSEFMTQMATELAVKGYNVLRFNFPYMQISMKDGGKRPPDRAPKLLNCFEYYLNLAQQDKKFTRIIVMGKSMGGRIAAILAETQAVDGVICLGYPFLPPKKLQPRLAPLQKSNAPVLVLQGERDRFGNKTQVLTWSLGKNTHVQWITDGDHSFAPRKSSRRTNHENISAASFFCDEFLKNIN